MPGNARSIDSNQGLCLINSAELFHILVLWLSPPVTTWVFRSKRCGFTSSSFKIPFLLSVVSPSYVTGIQLMANANVAAIAIVTVAMATTRNLRKMVSVNSSKSTDDIVAISGPLLYVNNSPENCTDNIVDHSMDLIMNALLKPWLMLTVYKLVVKQAIVTKIGIRSNEPAVTAFPVVSVARE